MTKVFISSVISGYEQYRAAARRAAEALGFDVLMAEDLPGLPNSPQSACLQLVRAADVTLVVLGERYGNPQASGLSATHEEFREARDEGEVLVMVQEGVEPETEQRQFIREAESWEHGVMRRGFTNPDELRDVVTRALHEYTQRPARGTSDPDELRGRAVALQPDGRSIGVETRLHLIVVGGPPRTVLSPMELEDVELARSLQERLTFRVPVLDNTESTDIRSAGESLVFQQRAAAVVVREDGSLRLTVAARSGDRQPHSVAGMALIEEDLNDRMVQLLQAAGLVLDEIDPVARLRDIIVQAGLTGASAVGWLTRAEAATNPSSISLGMSQRQEAILVPPLPDLRPRAALTADRTRIADDLTIRLRREVTS
jgi:hypothetical protein